MRKRGDEEFRARLEAVAERDRKARALCDEIEKKLPKGMTGVVMVNADTGEWLNAKDRDEGWKKAEKKWGKDIAHPPLWQITLTPQKEFIEKPENLRL